MRAHAYVCTHAHELLVFLTTLLITKIYIRTLVPKVCSTDSLGTATSSEGIRGYISVMDALKFTCLLIKGIMYC